MTIHMSYQREEACSIFPTFAMYGDLHVSGLSLKPRSSIGGFAKLVSSVRHYPGFSFRDTSI